MSFRLTAILLIVLIVLGGVVYYVESSPATPTPGTKTATVLSFLPTDVQQLDATGQGKTVTVARDADGKWLLKAPEQAPADQIRVDGLVSQLGALAATRTIDSPSSLAEFGLDQPKVQTKMTLKSGETPTLLLGDQTPDKGAYYAKLPDKPAVYLISVATGGDLARLLTDPPKATPTPTPFPTIVLPTPTPSPEPGSTPAATPTPAAAPAPSPTPAAIVPPAPTLVIEATPTPK